MSMNNLPQPVAVLFDWDDTIVNNWDTALKSLNTALTHMGMEAWSPEEARRRSGPTARALFGELFGDRWQEADKVYYETFLSLVFKNMKMFDGAQDTFKALADNGVAMGIVSNMRGALLKQGVDHMGLTHYFGVIFGAGDASADKPDPAPILEALQKLDIPPGPNVWYVGDSHTDMIAAAKAGCSGLLIETRVPPEDLLKDYPPTARAKDHNAIMECLRMYFVEKGNC